MKTVFLRVLEAEDKAAALLERDSRAGAGTRPAALRGGPAQLRELCRARRLRTG